ncbi:MAG: ABC transporter ATP-binding protein [Christensenellales bacterium]|jgi:ATP-binding cassette subfamily B multidrug efflux pump
MARGRIIDDEVIEMPFNKKQFGRVLTYLKPYRMAVVVTLLLSVVSSLCNLAGPFLMKIAIDNYIETKMVAGVVGVALAMLACTCVSALCLYLRVRLMDVAARKAIAALRQDLFNHIQELSFNFFDSRSAGKIMVRVINDVNSLMNLLTDGIINIIIDMFTLIVLIIVMLSINVPLTGLALCTTPLILLIVVGLKRKMRLRWQIVRRKSSTLNGYLHEALAGMRVTQSFVREEKNQEIFGEINDDIHHTWMAAVRINNLFWPCLDNIFMIGTVLIYWFGIRWINLGSITIGTLIAMTNYSGRFWEPLNNMSNFYNNILVAMASIERIFEIMDYPIQIQSKPEAVELPPIKGQVTFDHVTFSYDPEKVILKDVSFDVKPGQTIALVGPTGAGKSTVVNLVSRFYDTDSGAVRIDGYDVKEVNLHSLREQMGIMLQDSFIFSGTIMDNIRYGRLDATDEEVIAAAKAVHVHEFVSEMEKGYYTEVNERGSRLSVGQKQLISFARALLADPAILILDEATSSIDTHTEILIQQALDRLLTGRTSFVIAHRLSTIRKADRIMVVQDGTIAESGTHDELMAIPGGLYAELVQAQYRFLKVG